MYGRLCGPDCRLVDPVTKVHVRGQNNSVIRSDWYAHETILDLGPLIQARMIAYVRSPLDDRGLLQVLTADHATLSTQLSTGRSISSICV